MSKFKSDFDGPQTEEEFAQALGDLLLGARENQLDLLGSWVVEDGDRPTDLHVELTRLVEE